MSSMRIKAIAFNTFREAIRDKILYSLLFFALVMIGASVLLAKLTIGGFTKIVLDVGLGSISLFGTLIAIFVGIQLVNKEIDRRTIYTLLSKPLHRWEFILGKYLGLVTTLLVEVSIMTAGLFGLVFFTSGEVILPVFNAVGLIFLELLLLTAFAVLFSCFSTPTMSALFSLSVFVIGHMTDDIYLFGKQSEHEMIQLGASFLYFVLPNLEYFNIKNQVVHNVTLLPGQMSFAVGYGVLYVFIVLMGATVIFQQRDFK